MISAAFLADLAATASAEGVRQVIVRAVVRRGGRVLLLRRPPGAFRGGEFELPGGKVDPGETLDQALVREVREETGLAVTGIADYLGAVDYTSALSGAHVREFTFAVTTTTTEPITLDEHDTYRWSPTPPRAS
ncbi:NUDIX domain-containing protein [Goodfellowiella coeruleoviolacea]|uniref:8-oxo-dGTP diphosphatase n=1 Tax=Goodfellowiella coeruleoviolacea TaxID=334858 RepID=A0AAE3GNX7_9PSEU|nr:NUDIX domain-containing protein [Goodfellowiella coeruleoviolacea]MCP2169498.1 8-oxo-dGTP diphosphatase [Goodfellowiella coeruleoviolacea]